MARGRGRIRRAALVVAAVVGALVLAAGPAWADVQVFADHSQPGAENVTLTFRVTNAGDAASTTRLQVLLPTDTPLLGVAAAPQDGWTPSLATTILSVPVRSASGPVTTAVSSITWTGGTITGTAGEDFSVHVGKLPDGVGSLAFQVLQTDDAGRTVAWFDIAASGGPTPEHPAPVLSLGAATQEAPRPTAPQHHPGTAPGPNVGTPVAPPATAASVGWTTGVAALGAAVVTAAAVALGRRQRRRFNALNGDVRSPAAQHADQS